jgi:UPF0755 protein
VSERTPEEREAARREREARRVSGADDPVPPPLTAFAAAESPPSGQAPIALDAEADDVSAESDGVPAELEREIPSGVRRVRGVRGHGVGAVTQHPAIRPSRSARERRSLVPRVVAVLALVLAAVAIWFLVELFQPFHGSGHGTVVVTVPSGATAGTIGAELARDGVVSSGFFFGLRATLAGDRGSLRAGVYRLQHGMSYGAALSVLTTPPTPAPTTNVTVIPGRTRREIATLLHDQGVRGSYLAATRRTTLLNVRAYGAPRGLDSLEGFLFPSTYQVRDPISIASLVADQLTTFRRQFGTVDMSYARSKNLTPYDVLIIASMVEAEAGTVHDFPLVASVIYNRLRSGMRLGIDATVRYAVGNYTSPLTYSQLSSPSPYNTRVHTGLTPTPIDNPSLAAIHAAAQPARTGYLYFVAKPCGNGASAFSSNYAQFQADVQRYNQARANRGGRSPVACRG